MSLTFLHQLLILMLSQEFSYFPNVFLLAISLGMYYFVYSTIFNVRFIIPVQV